MQDQLIDADNLSFDALKLRTIPLRTRPYVVPKAQSKSTESEEIAWSDDLLNHFRLKKAARFASVLAAVPKTQPPRLKVVDDHIRRVSALVQKLQENPSEAIALTREILSACDVFLAAPQGTKPEDAEIVDTQALRDEVEAMIKDGPRVKYPGGSAEEAKSFFQTHYGNRYNRDGLQVIFSPDLYVIDHVLMRALRAAYGAAAYLPLGDRKDRTDAIAAGRFGDELARLKTRQALYKRVYNVQYGKR